MRRPTPEPPRGGGGVKMALERELAAYRAALPGLLAAGLEGHYVVVGGDEVAGAYPTYEVALGAGYDRFGLDPFLVKQVARVEPILHA
jgi:hypothetical protein